MTNLNIYITTQQLLESFKDSNQYLPIKLNFYIQKNKKTFLELAQGIDESRMAIVQHYGTLDSNTGNYIVAPENVAAANKEIVDLLSIEQDVNILKVKFEDIPENISLTTGQMEAIMFMIE
jgi:hypothetical protein